MGTPVGEEGMSLSFPRLGLVFAKVFRDRRGNIAFEIIDLVEGDAAFEAPLVFRPVDADVVHARSDDEAKHAAPVIERPPVTGVNGSIDAIRAGHEIE